MFTNTPHRIFISRIYKLQQFNIGLCYPMNNLMLNYSSTQRILAP